MAEESVNKTEEIVENAPSSEINSKMTAPSFLEKMGDFFQGKAKTISIIVGVIIVAIAGWFGYQKFIVEPENIKTAEAVHPGEAYIIDEQNWEAAIKGDSTGGTYVGLAAQAKSFAGYAGGDIATYDLGIAYLNNGQDQEALTTLQNVNFEDEVLATMALGAMGDASMNLEKYSDAADYYNQAYTRRPKNELTAPLYMLKLANTNELLEKYDEAAKLYQNLITNFPNSEFVPEAKKNLVFVEAGTSIYQIK